MPLSVLFTQCLQRDFIEPVAPHAPLPNRLHVGRREAVRLLGPDPENGPVAQLMAWARGQDPGGLEIVHIRDWHDPGDPRQEAHLGLFGPHCVAGTPGAELVLDLDPAVNHRSNERFVDAVTLNDFEGTDLGAVVDALRARSPDGALRVGVVGVWTEAKVTFLMYELSTRCGVSQLATCSALTASASRSQHFNALGQLERILGARVFDSVGDFAEWLRPGGGALTPPARGLGPHIHLEVRGGAETLSPTDRLLVDTLYRDSDRLQLSPLSGGFSGAAVYRALSQDALGHEQAPTVVKLGPRHLIGHERAAFERVEEILGNDAPSVRGFVEHGERAGLKYAYAAMGHGPVRTFQHLYLAGAPQAEVDRVLDETFGDVLGRFTRAAQYERLPLLEYYGFSPRYAEGVRRTVAGLVPDADAAVLEFPGGFRAMNVADFYGDALARMPAPPHTFHYVSYVHGDLNGANILVDARGNVWLIDFFHTARGHALQDLVKLENDLLYIFTPIPDAETLAEALLITQALSDLRDLAAPLPETLPGLERPSLRRTWATLRTLRRHVARVCGEDRNPYQWHVAALRYAAHTLGFDEPDRLQRTWALAAAGRHAEQIVRAGEADRRLRVDWLPPGSPPGPGGLGLTICPGRRDRGRTLEEDLAALREDGVTMLVSLLTEPELVWAGAPHLPEAALAAGLEHRWLPIPDQEVPGLAEARALVAEVRAAVARGERVALHCMGGLGRSGLIAAAALHPELSGDAAIEVVRAARDPRAVETQVQEEFVRRFPGAA